MQRKILILTTVFVFAAYLGFSQGLKVEPGTNLNIETGTTLDMSGGNLVLASDASGDASLLNNGSVTYSGGGTAKVQRYLTKGKWHLISSPVSNAQAGMFTGDYLQSFSENTNGWTNIIATTAGLGIMQGYALWSVAATATTEVFTGTTNTGDQSMAFTQVGQGWNLVGNPYPSALDWDAVTIPAQLDGAIWIFDPTIGSNGDYDYYINGGGAANTTTQYISSGQGFFVRTTGGSGTLTLHNSDRAHNTQSFFKNSGSVHGSSENSSRELLVLKTTGNGITTQTAIRFNANATQNVDRLYDVYRMMSDSPEVPMLFTKVGNELLAINTLPSIENNDTVPVWFRAGKDGTYSINANGTETFDANTPIYLEDLKTGDLQNLRTTPEYTFTYKSGIDRKFQIIFESTLGIKPQQKIKNNIRIYAYHNMLHVNFPASFQANGAFHARIMVFDLTGRKVLQKVTTQITNKIPLSGSNSLYIIKVVSKSGTAGGKVFIK